MTGIEVPPRFRADALERVSRAIDMPIGRPLGAGSFGEVFQTTEPFVVKLTSDAHEARQWQLWQDLPGELYPAIPRVRLIRRVRWQPGPPAGVFPHQSLWVVVREEAAFGTEAQSELLDAHYDELMAIRQAHRARRDGQEVDVREPLVALLESALGDLEVYHLAVTLLRLHDDGSPVRDLHFRNFGLRIHPELGEPSLLLLDPRGPGGREVVGELVANRSRP